MSDVAVLGNCLQSAGKHHSLPSSARPGLRRQKLPFSFSYVNNVEVSESSCRVLDHCDLGWRKRVTLAKFPSLPCASTFARENSNSALEHPCLQTVPKMMGYPRVRDLHSQQLSDVRMGVCVVGWGDRERSVEKVGTLFPAQCRLHEDGRECGGFCGDRQRSENPCVLVLQRPLGVIGAQASFSCRTFPSSESLHRNTVYTTDISGTTDVESRGVRCREACSLPLLQLPGQCSVKHFWGSHRTLRLAR